MSKPTVSNVEVNVSQFVFDHGKRPAGHGFWFFEIAGQQFSWVGSFAETKNLAKLKAVELGAWDVKVLS